MRTYDLIAIAWITMTVMSCHKDIVDSYETETVKTTDEIIAGIPKDTDTLTEADAAIVAKMRDTCGTAMGYVIIDIAERNTIYMC